MSAVLQLCIRLLPFPVNIPYFLICVSIRSPRRPAQSSSFLTWKRLKLNFKDAFKHYVSFQDKGKKKGTDCHLQGHSPLVMMFVTNPAKLRSICQQFQYPSSSHKTHNLTHVHWRFKGLMSSLGKGNMTGLLARLDTATAGYYEYLLHSYPEGKNDIFYTEGT